MSRIRPSFQLRTDFASGPRSSEEGIGSLNLNHGDFHFRPLILENFNRLLLELSVPKGSAVCSKRNISITARFDSSLLSTQPLILALGGAEPIQQIQNHADPCQVHPRIAPQSHDHLQSRDSGRIKEQHRPDLFNRFEETMCHEPFDQAGMDLSGGDEPLQCQLVALPSAKHDLVSSLPLPRQLPEFGNPLFILWG
jgi:hypothetical protein